MKPSLFLHWSLILVTSCQTPKNLPAQQQQASKKSQAATAPNTFVSDRYFQDYIPVSPVDFDQQVDIYNPDTKAFEPRLIAELVADPAKVRAFLSNQSGYTAVQKLDGSGELKFGPATVTAEAGSYNVYFDYGKFTTLRVAKGDGTCPGFAKVGVGFRIVARITTYEAGIDVSSLMSIGVSAKLSKLSGELSVEVIGIDSPKVTDLMTLPVDISQASIQNAFQSMAAIKSRIWDDDVRLTPKVMGIKKAAGTCSLADIFSSNDPVRAVKSVK